MLWPKVEPREGFPEGVDWSDFEKPLQCRVEERLEEMG